MSDVHPTQRPPLLPKSTQGLHSLVCVYPVALVACMDRLHGNQVGPSGATAVGAALPHLSGLKSLMWVVKRGVRLCVHVRTRDSTRLALPCPFPLSLSLSVGRCVLCGRRVPTECPGWTTIVWGTRVPLSSPRCCPTPHRCSCFGARLMLFLVLTACTPALVWPHGPHPPTRR